MKISFEVKGIDEMQKSFNNAENIIQNESIIGMRNALALMVNKAKTFAPVITGTLRRSIHTEGPFKEQKKIIGLIGTDVTYAPYVELGTRYFIGRFYFTTAYQETKETIKDIFKDVTDQIISKINWSAR